MTSINEIYFLKELIKNKISSINNNKFQKHILKFIEAFLNPEINFHIVDFLDTSLEHIALLIIKNDNQILFDYFCSIPSINLNDIEFIKKTKKIYNEYLLLKNIYSNEEDIKSLMALNNLEYNNVKKIINNEKIMLESCELAKSEHEINIIPLKSIIQNIKLKNEMNTFSQDTHFFWDLLIKQKTLSPKELKDFLYSNSIDLWDKNGDLINFIKINFQ